MLRHYPLEHSASPLPSSLFYPDKTDPSGLPFFGRQTLLPAYGNPVWLSSWCFVSGFPVHPGDPFTKKSLFLSWFYQYGQSKFHHSFLWHSFFESIRHGFPFLIFTSDNCFFFGKPYILSPFSTKRQGTSCSLLPKSHNFPVFERYHFR